MPKQILLVEDSMTMQKVIEITFAHEDYRVTSARDGEEALARLRDLRPDVVIIDANLQAPSGYDLAAALKGEPAGREVPVLLLTGNFNPYDEPRGQRAGVDAHVVKPFETQVLIDKIADLLRRRSGAAGTSTANTLIAMPPLPGGLPTGPGGPSSPAPVQSTAIGSMSPATENRRATIPPVAPARPMASALSQAARPALDTGLQRSTLMGIPAVNPLGAPGLRPPPPPGMRVRETGNMPAINPPPQAPSSASVSGMIGGLGAPAPSSASSSMPSWGARSQDSRSLDLGRPIHSGPPSAALAPVAAAPAQTPIIGGAGIPGLVPQMPRLPLLPRAPLPAAVTAVLERIAQRGAEYEAIAKLSVEAIEQICWEVIPELAEVILKAEVERHILQLAGQQAKDPDDRG